MGGRNLASSRSSEQTAAVLTWPVDHCSAGDPAAVSSAQLTPEDVEVCDVVEAAREGRRPLDYVVREVQARLGAALHRWAGVRG